MPPHVIELLTKGSAADGSRAIEELGLDALRSTLDVCTELFEWATVTPLRPEVSMIGASRG